MRPVADNTVRRLSLYLRFLEEFQHEGASTVSSEALATRGGTTSAQVRKDLSFFGSFGKRGLGYSVPQLIKRLREILGLGRRYRVIVIGAGKVGSALARYRGFAERGFEIVAIFDRDAAKIGQRWNGLVVRDVASLEREAGQLRPDIAILVTPAEAAQEVADRLVAVGVTAILNFAPVQLTVPPAVTVKHVNMVLEMELLSFALASRDQGSGLRGSDP
jgi:redox-sensing transcriptional repressor